MDNIENNSAFLEFFFTTTPKQQIWLAKNLTPEQTLVILEILHNLYKLDHSQEDIEFYSKNKAVLKKFEKKRPFKLRKKVLHSKARTILKIINHFKSKLIDLIR